ncbi:hypothetical protein KN815_47050 [Streptomyces sp. 4503]|uniref:MBL fold metallo-hydrolase n=1 Tax=Streptomyces niphimycinicus TaxID=2842201 RepID=A0ABS6CWK3_9ACTN|nr:hypothetical protein [Streptomyces niphimycinicus]MBU3871342.1 hypothetical protein [Streptomyces niphimycinicus]
MKDHSQVRVTALPGSHAPGPVAEAAATGDGKPRLPLAHRDHGRAPGAGLVKAVRPERVLPVHYDDYAAFSSPLSAFLEESGHPDVPSTVVHCARGVRVTVNAQGVLTAP